MSKNNADQHLLGLNDISGLVIRPSVVHSTGSYGGTSLFRGLSALPFAMPMMGQGDQLMAPIFLNDLANAVLHYVEHPEISGKVLYAVGPEQVTMKGFLSKIRQWLGFKKAPVIRLPNFFFSILARLGDFFERSPVNSTSLIMLANV